MTSPYESELSLLSLGINNFSEKIRSHVSNAIQVNANYGIPFFTGITLNGREIWSVIFDFGTLPKSSWKTLLISENITSVWGDTNDHWIDSSNSFAYAPGEKNFPLPHVGDVNKAGISLEIVDDTIRCKTRKNLSTYQAIVAIKYFKDIT